MIAGGMLAATTTAGHAAAIDCKQGIYEGTMSVAGDESGLSFRWFNGNLPVGAYYAFEAGTSFDLTLEHYPDLGGGNPDPRLSGYILEETDRLNGDLLEGGTLTTDFAACGQGLFESLTYESCNQVSFAGYDGTSSGSTAEPGDILLVNLDPGYYRLIFVESGSPANGGADFGISRSTGDPGVIPLPASGFLLLGALGALGLRAKRKPA